MPLTPLLGYYTDLKGKRSLLAIIGGILNVAQFVIFMVVPTCEDGTCSSANFIVPLAIGGVANSFFGAGNTYYIFKNYTKYKKWYKTFNFYNFEKN